MKQDFELLLTRKAWEDPDFAELLASDPEKALTQLGVTVPEGVKLKIILQKPDTLYFTIPPVNKDAGSRKKFLLNQIDIWSSSRMFIWLASAKQKVKLLQLRSSVFSKGDGNE